MTSATVAEADFRIGAVVRASLRVLRNNIVTFGLLYMAVNAASSIYALTLAGTADVDTSPGVNLLALAEAFVGIIVSAAVTYATVQELRGRRVDVAEFFGRGLAQGGAALKVALLSAILLILAFIALVLPGLVLYMMWWVAVPVAVIERPGTVASLRRSAELTKGFRWRIFGLFLVFLLVVVGGGLLLIAVVFFAIGLSVDIGAVALDSLTIVAGWILSAALMTVQAVLIAVSYYHLRVAKEGVGIDEIAAVFD
jgi:hypothetical protein